MKVKDSSPKILYTIFMGSNGVKITSKSKFHRYLILKGDKINMSRINKFIDGRNSGSFTYKEVLWTFIKVISYSQPPKKVTPVAVSAPVAKADPVPMQASKPITYTTENQEALIPTTTTTIYGNLELTHSASGKLLFTRSIKSYFINHETL